jgi:quercetin dioxygenase-like cupin family protein
MTETRDAAGELPRGEILVVQPGSEESYWQPLPANGSITTLIAPHLVPMVHKLSMGTQTLPPGGYVREHAHVRQEEAFFFLSGNGKAVVDGVDHRCRPGTVIFIGAQRFHMFVNDGDTDMTWLWMLVPNGLEEFFAAIGRRREPDDPVPGNFPRPADVREIEDRMGFRLPRSADRR